MSRPRLVTWPFGALVCAHFLASLGFASMLLLPLYLDHLGASRAEIGAIMASAAVGGLLSRPLVAAGLDAVGRKPTLAVGTLVAVLGMSTVWLIDDVGPGAWITRILFGVGEGALFASYFTFVTDLVPPSRRTEGIALFGVSGLLPLMVSPVATLIGVQASDLRWFLPAVGVLVASSLLFLWPLSEPRAPSPERLSVREAGRALTGRPLWPVWWATIVFAGLLAVFMTFVAVVAERRGLAFPTALWFAYAGGAAGVRLVGARLPDRVGPRNMVIPSLGVYAAALWVAAGATDAQGFLLAGGLAGLGHGYCFPVLTTQVVARVADRYRGSALSLFTALWSLCSLALAPAAGALADAAGDAVMFRTAAGTGVVMMAIWIVMELRWGRDAPA